MSHWSHQIFKEQASALLRLADLNPIELDLTIEKLVTCTGKVILSGIGKSGLVAQKITASLACVGCPAIFLHGTDALHGDIGLLKSNDIVIFISHSGKTRELLNWKPILKRLACLTVIITSDIDSPLALESEIVLNTGVSAEACPLDFLPTTSSLCSMAIGDLLAIGMMQRKKMTLGDLAHSHPLGHLGERVCFI
ncbi:MAG: SIS domain-containing protein [Myxococcaceae bacterium]